ncbi:MAG: hypothetical protein KDB07_09600, partial [Planctomycetes bacterium]|nr:hypothetical protein [Planctomycetota bacterium]
TQTSGGADIALQVIDQRGNIVAEVDPAGINDPMFMNMNLERGTYVLVLLNAETAMAGTYDIGVSALAQGTP